MCLWDRWPLGCISCLARDNVYYLYCNKLICNMSVTAKTGGAPRCVTYAQKTWLVKCLNRANTVVVSILVSVLLLTNVSCVSTDSRMRP